MSSWTYVIGTIEVETMAQTNAEALYIAQTVVDHLPKISGSEENANIYINLERGYRALSNSDEFDICSNLGTGWHGNFETQDAVLITIEGSLRDREFEQTLTETSKFLCRLSKRLFITKCVVKVNEHNKDYIFTNNADWLTENYPDVNEGCWTDYLRKE